MILHCLGHSMVCLTSLTISSMAFITNIKAVRMKTTVTLSNDNKIRCVKPKQHVNIYLLTYKQGSGALRCARVITHLKKACSALLRLSLLTSLGTTTLPRGFTLQNTAPRASLQFSKWHPFYSISDPPSSNHFPSMTVVIILKPYSKPKYTWLVNILACLDDSRLAKSGGVAAYQNEQKLLKKTHVDKQFS